MSNKTSQEIAAELLLAILPSAKFTEYSTPQELAEEVGSMFTAIYRHVQRANPPAQ